MKSNPRDTNLLLALSLFIGGGAISIGILPTAQAETVASANGWPLFAFDNGIGRDQGWKPSEQAKLTAKLGYDGIGYTRVDDLEARYAACDAEGQRICSFYEPFNVGDEHPVDPKTLERLPQLRDKDVIIWIYVAGQGTDEEVVQSFRQFADEADEYGVRVAIYPHFDAYVETAEHALRLAKAVDRDNFGMSINVCHELKSGNGDKLVDLARDSGDHLFLVSINGADQIASPLEEKHWSRLIQPLGKGDLDLLPLLKQLRTSGYQGPIGVQCFQIPGEIEDILSQSITAWHEMLGQLSKE